MQEYLIRDFTKLNVWIKANEVEQQIFNITKKFPKTEQYRLVDQIIRSSRGVSANISEGVSVNTKGRAIYHIKLASGSNAETRNHIITAYQCNYISKDEFESFEESLLQITKMLSALLRTLYQKIDDE